jgi:hypothetical protein
MLGLKADAGRDSSEALRSFEAAARRFAARAGLPTIPAPPRVRDIQRLQLTTALPWAARTLGLPPQG